MINLLPPSPAPSQIDTTFIRRERAEFSTERPTNECDCSHESEDVQRSEDTYHVDDDEQDEDRADSSVETPDFQTLLNLSSQPKPQKKPIDPEAVVETKPSDGPRDEDSSQNLIAAAQWILLQKTETTPIVETTTKVDTTAAILKTSQDSSTTQATDKSSPSAAAADVLASLKTNDNTSTIEQPTTTASPIEKSVADAVPTATAEPELGASQDVASIKVETGFDEVVEVPMEIVSQTSRTATVNTAAENTKLETTFDASKEPVFNASEALVERDEITREIERLISARPSQTLPRLVSPAIRTPLETLTLTTAGITEGAAQVSDTIKTQIPSDSAVASTELKPIQTLLQPSRSDNQSMSQQGDEGRPQQHAPTSASNGISATGWSSSSTVSNDFVATTRAEFQEPLSSQTARAIVQHFETRESNDNEKLTVRLDPPELGELTIELSQTRDGLAVRVTAREAVTMEMLLSRGHEIEQHLKNQNVDVATMEFLSSGMMNQQSSRQNASRNSQSDLMLESSQRQSKASSSSAADNRRDAAAVRDAARPLSFRA